MEKRKPTVDRSGYLIDMDGVIYRGSHLIEGAQKFIGELSESKVTFPFEVQRACNLLTFGKDRE